MSGRCWPDHLVTPVPCEALTSLPVWASHAADVHMQAGGGQHNPSRVLLDRLLGRQTQKASEAGFENSCELRKYGTSVREEQPGGGHRHKQRNHL